MSHHVRRAMCRDLPVLLRVDRKSFAVPWGEALFRARMDRATHYCLVAESTDRSAPGDATTAAGFVVFRVVRASSAAEVVRLAVAPAWRRWGVGLDLLISVFEHARLAGLSRVRCAVPDDLLGAHLFFRAAGFRATAVLEHLCGPSVTDHYLFECAVDPFAVPATATPPPIGDPPRFVDWSNRLAGALGELVGRHAHFRPAVDHLMRLLGKIPANLGPLPVPEITPLPANHPDPGAIRLEWAAGGRRIILAAHPGGISVKFSQQPARGVLPERGPQADHLAASLAWLYGLPAPPARYVFEEEDRSQC